MPVLAISVFSAEIFATRGKPAKNFTDSIKCRQVLVVVTDGWSSVQGELHYFTKHKRTWKEEFSNEVVVGKTGLGIGDGLVDLSIKGAPIKKEGDLRSPAGIFKIGTAFGYADPSEAEWIKNAYVKASDALLCVDDVHSVYYNRLVKSDTGNADWKSFEYMHRKDNYYKWGLFVEHNSGNIVPGDGSCIFLHIWENRNEGTIGCTAMQEKDILNLLRSIDSTQHPILVQLPKNEYLKIRGRYGLPAIN